MSSASRRVAIVSVLGALHVQTVHAVDCRACLVLDCVGLKEACEPADCTTEGCLRLNAGVTSCNACIAAEARCVTSSCRRACGTSGTDDSCRACACSSGCVALFASCAGRRLDVCSDCNATTCERGSMLPPELIMVVVDGLF